MVDDTIEQYYENYFELFATEGWKQFIAECNTSLADCSSILNCTSAEQFWEKRGQATAYHRVANFENYIRAAHELEKENADNA